MVAGSSFRVDFPLRRLTFAAPVVILTLVGTLCAATMAGPRAATPLGALLILLFALTFGWLVASCWGVFLGFYAHLTGKGSRLEEEAATVPLAPSGNSRTALVMPIYNEDPGLVFAAVGVMARSLAKVGADDIEIFVLSDTQDPAIAQAESEAYDQFLATGEKVPPVYYRRREDNAGRKAGNIADFCINWGSRYDFMVVLDADSLMSGATVRRMIALMERHPKIGILQTCSNPANRETLFARVLQFAARLYVPLSVKGLDFWMQRDGNYWGHNAIVRIKPFMAHCDLPVLPGREPLGGQILCHDVVEAALMRRGGYEVWVLPHIEGTWEEMPTNLIDFAKRDRRWCQGNLQHIRFLPAEGVKWSNRIHLGMGIATYMSAPIWLAFIAVSLLQFFVATHGGADSSSDGVGLLTSGLFSSDTAATVLFSMSLALVFGPKLMSLGVALSDPRTRRGFGGWKSLVASTFLEQVFTTLMAPVMALFYTQFVFSILAGRMVSWDSQPRDDRGVSWREAWIRHRIHFAIGAVAAVGVASLDQTIFWWMSPIFCGLTLAAPFTVLSSRLEVGRWARKLGLFLTPDEVEPEHELQAIRSATATPATLPVRPATVDAARPALPVPVPTPMQPQRLDWEHVTEASAVGD
ncbi:MAG TPA: glucans biosynthesis glucosyltransferase MdoH [Stellaceae bacterium]